MGLKVKKWLTNSQFELREQWYFFKKKNLSSGLKIIHLFVKVDRNVYKTAKESAMIHTKYSNPILARPISMIFYPRF